MEISSYTYIIINSIQFGISLHSLSYSRHTHKIDNIVILINTVLLLTYHFNAHITLSSRYKTVSRSQHPIFVLNSPVFDINEENNGHFVIGRKKYLIIKLYNQESVVFKMKKITLFGQQ